MAYIYKIEVGDCLYIGSTNDMKNRQRQHNYKLRNDCDYPIYTYCRENGIIKLKLIQLEYVDIEDRLIVEQYYIDEFKTGHKLLNNRNTMFNINEYDRKEDDKAYYKKNKDKILNYQKAYHENNRDKMIEKAKTYYEANKDKINEQKRANYHANKALTHQPEPQEASAK